MAKVAVYNMEGKEVDSLELNDAIFGVRYTLQHSQMNRCR